ncbi:MAG: hypothetical protein J6T10_08845 [Methanobrevibacter sp.]|nr:hypothetical protein [Methanobrevibacter sp.]
MVKDGTSIKKVDGTSKKKDGTSKKKDGTSKKKDGTSIKRVDGTSKKRMEHSPKSMQFLHLITNLTNRFFCDCTFQANITRSKL